MNDGWENKEDKLVRIFSFKNFAETIKFVNKVAELSEIEKHHPDIEINYDKVRLVLWTHSMGKVTNKDYALSEKIDALTS